MSSICWERRTMAERAGYEVIRVDADGSGVIDLAGGLMQPEAIPGALPGDVARRREGDGWDVEAKPGPYRRAVQLCPHASTCGGCTVQHMADDFYERWKAANFFDALAQHQLVEIDATDDPIEPMVRTPLQSRRRAVLTAKADAGRLRLGFHERRSHRLVDIAACAVISPSIVSALPALREIATIVAASGDCRLTVLDTTKGLDVAIETDTPRRRAMRLADLTRITAPGRILRLTVDGDPVLVRALPRLEIAGVAVEPPPGAFVQATAEAEAAMARIAVAAITAAKARRVADLFCGLGAFAFAMAREARVLAIDSDRPMIEALTAAARNASGLKPIETKVRDLFTDPLSQRELDHIDAVVLDPPRAGARAQAAALAKSKVRTVIAVSCNPATLARDLRILIDGGYRLVRAVPVDQFLFTPHLEAVAVLRR